MLHHMPILATLDIFITHLTKLNKRKTAWEMRNEVLLGNFYQLELKILLFSRWFLVWENRQSHALLKWFGKEM